MMALLEMRDAVCERRGRTIAGPATLCVDDGEHLSYACQSHEAARVLAMMAGGLVRRSSGTVFVAAFDPCIQPVQVKRITGFVPHEAVPHDFASFTRYAEYRAALWGLPIASSVVRARSILAQLEGVHEQFAYPLAGALLAAPRLLVLDRPQAVYAAQILHAAGSCAIFSTHAGERDAALFSERIAVPI